MSDVSALDLLLTARYAGGGAFGAMSSDIESLVNASNRLSRIGSAFKVVGDAMIGAGLAAAAGLGVAVKVASDYETAINRIVAVTPQLQTHSNLLAQLNSQIASSSTAWGISPTSEAQGAYFLFSSLGALGVSPQQFLQALSPQYGIISDLAAYVRASGWPGEGGVDFSTAAQVLPRLFTAANSPLSQWGGNMGILTYLENQSHTTQAQLASALNSFLPTMVTLGMPFSEAATLMAAEASAGRVGSPAGREMMSALTLMFSGKPEQAQLQALGLKSSDFFSKSGQLLPTDQIVGMLQASLYSHANSPAQLLSLEKNLFGQVGLRTMGPLLAAGGYSRYQNLIAGEKSLGILNNPKMAELYMRSVADRMMQSPGAQWDRFKASMELLAITIGEKVIPPLEKLGNFADNAALKLTTFANAHPKLASALALGAVPSLLGGGFSLKGIGSVLQYLGENPSAAKSLMAPFKGLAAWGSHGFGLGGLWDAATLRMFPNARIAAALPWGKVGGNSPLETLRGVGADFGMHAGNIGGAATAFGKAVTGMAAHPINKLIKPAVRGFGDLFGAILKVGPALAGLAGAALPIVAIVLLVAGAIATGVLIFTRFRSEGARLAGFFSSVFGPIIRQVIATAVQQFHNIQAAWASVQPQLASGIHQLVNAFISARPAFQLFGTVIGDALKLIITIIGWLIQAFLRALPFIINVFTGIFNVIADVSHLVLAIIHGQWGQIPGILGSLLGHAKDIVVNLFLALWTFISGTLGRVLGLMLGFGVKLGGAVLGWTGMVLGQLGGLKTRVLGFFGNLSIQMLRAGGTLIQNLVNGIRSGLGNLAGTMASVASTITSHIPVVGGLLSHLPHFASGGDMGRAGWAIVGEHGPELVRLPGASHVFNNSDTSRIGNLHVENLHMPGQSKQDNLGHFRLANYLDQQRQLRLMRYNPDLDALAYQERIGSQYTA